MIYAFGLCIVQVLPSYISRFFYEKELLFKSLLSLLH